MLDLALRKNSMLNIHDIENESNSFFWYICELIEKGE